eukprot:TRINITY_DN29313_c0_g1_i1.p1 TRINITY_DN29313_c0_g1~~TRINITY_DN29313_c0_g1_i1.p1  ORF type:complete len:322 (+),score=59.00 TRINITY_DN29313_c0_g1_i1:74-967(+)
MVSRLAAALATALYACAEAAAPEHMQWQVSKDGLVQLRSRPEMRLNVKGGGDIEAGQEVVIWHCQAHAHEQFEFVGTQIKLKSNPQLCLNAERGAQESHPIVTWSCSPPNELGDNEQFVMKPNGKIQVKDHPELCLNVKAGLMQPGAEIILWRCSDGDANDLFKVNEYEISVLKHPHLHFNVAGADISQPNQRLVLWTCDGGNHEVFDFAKDGRIHLKAFPTLCLNAAGGLGVGHKIVVWPCQDTPAKNELFTFDEESGVIFATKSPDLGFNAAGGALQGGDSLVLWPLDDKHLSEL